MGRLDKRHQIGRYTYMQRLMIVVLFTIHLHSLSRSIFFLKRYIDTLRSAKENDRKIFQLRFSIELNKCRMLTYTVVFIDY